LEKLCREYEEKIIQQIEKAHCCADKNSVGIEAAFPLTPALSLGERERLFQRWK
jgi:hypothetical protein